MRLDARWKSWGAIRGRGAQPIRDDLEIICSKAKTRKAPRKDMTILRSGGIGHTKSPPDFLPNPGSREPLCEFSWRSPHDRASDQAPGGLALVRSRGRERSPSG